MKVIRDLPAFYPAFPLGCEPCAVPCRLMIVEVDGGDRYVKTPMAFYPAHDEQDLERLLEPGRMGCYHATAEACMTYLAAEYPWQKQAEPIMQALALADQRDGAIPGHGRVADRAEVSPFEICKIARGHRSFSLKTVKAAVKALARNPNLARV